MKEVSSRIIRDADIVYDKVAAFTASIFQCHTKAKNAMIRRARRSDQEASKCPIKGVIFFLVEYAIE